MKKKKINLISVHKSFLRKSRRKLKKGLAIKERDYFELFKKQAGYKSIEFMFEKWIKLAGI